MRSTLDVGIDIGKTGSVAALLSKDLLAKHGRFEACPTLAFPQSRAGFEKLLATLCVYAPPRRCRILLERTGHYGFALEQFLFEAGCKLYRITPKKKYGRQKTDKNDAQGLAVLLYSQVELKTPMTDKSLRVRPLVPPSPEAQLLRGLVQHRFELQSECTMRKNKLTALLDEIFPEFTLVCKDPNLASALALRSAFPTPAAIAAASLQELYAARLWTYPGNVALAHLQELAASTIGTKSVYRQQSIIIEQRQIVAELRLQERHIAELDLEIERVVTASREGQILTSFTGIGTTHAAALLASIGNIANFESAAELRGFAGWSPKRSQTGSSYDSTTLTRGGNAMLRPTLFLVTAVAIQHDLRWKTMYDQLVPKKCWFDPRKKKWRGKMKVMGRVAGSILGVIYALLKRDADLLASLPKGAVPPPPELYRRNESTHAADPR